MHSTHTGSITLNCPYRNLPPLSKLHRAWPIWSYPLASKARAGANGAKIFFLPLFSHVVRLPIVVTCCLIYVDTQIISTCKTENNNTDLTPLWGWVCFSPKFISSQPTSHMLMGIIRKRGTAVYILGQHFQRLDLINWKRFNVKIEIIF